MLLASAPLLACAQSMLPGGTQPARALPAKVASRYHRATVEPRTMLRSVTILRGQTSVEVHIEASGPVKPAALVLSAPDRIVVDLADVGYDGSRHFPVNTGDVEGVRVALFHANPPITRVVVDLAHPHDYHLLPAGSTVILAIDTRPKPTIATAPAKAKVAEVPLTVAPVAVTPQPASEAKLQPPPLATRPNAPSSGATEAAVPAPASPQPAPEQGTQPAAPTVSASLPQVATVAVPARAAQTPGEEETTPHQAAKGQKPGVVRNISVSREKDTIEVHIEASKPLRAAASTLSNPERIVIDLADVRLHHPQHIQVHGADVHAVNASLYLVNPLVTRVVVDLARPHPYHVQASGSSLTVRIDTGTETAGSKPAQ